MHELAESEVEQACDKHEHVELDVQFVASATPEQCLGELFEMIMRGYGRWLPDTLRKTKKGIAAGIACLDMVSADYPNIRRKDLEKALRYIIRKKTARYDLEVDRYFIYVRPKAPEREGGHE